MLSASMGAFCKENKQDICGNLRRCLVFNITRDGGKAEVARVNLG